MRRHPRTAIGNRHPDHPAVVGNSHLHALTWRRKFTGVGEQVAHHLDKAIDVCTHPARLGWSLKQQRHPEGGGEPLRLPNRALNQCGKIHCFDLERHFSSSHALAVEYVVDKPHQTLAILHRDADQLPRLVRKRTGHTRRHQA